MDLVYKFKTKEIERIESRLRDLSLAYKLVTNGSSDEPALIDGSSQYFGISAMLEYIDLLDREKEKWYYCDC